jgi:hypothetical protein
MDFFASPEKFYVVQEWAQGGDVSLACSSSFDVIVVMGLYFAHAMRFSPC